ncbi:MAG: hypothetical protein KAV00_14610 [Phycisphaerae bacterium]|nr:hypothetical protein [Phycisphaerae bacterium]
MLSEAARVLEDAVRIEDAEASTLSRGKLDHLCRLAVLGRQIGQRAAVPRVEKAGTEKVEKNGKKGKLVKSPTPGPIKVLDRAHNKVVGPPSGQD